METKPGNEATVRSHVCFHPGPGISPHLPATSRVEPQCSRFRHRSISVIRLAFANRRRCPNKYLDFLPSAPSSNRKSSFPRYGSPTIFFPCAYQ